MATTQPQEDIYSVLLTVQKNMKAVVKGQRAEVGKFSYKYADLATVFETLMPTLHANNIVLLQPTDVSDNGDQVVVTVLHHVPSNTSLTSSYIVRSADAKDPQKMGGALTYARRYALLSLIGAAPEDDDGQYARTPPEPSASEQFTAALKADKVTKESWEQISNKLFKKVIPTAELTDAQKKQYLNNRTMPAF